MKLGLGTAQFGLDYGVSNTAGQVTADTASAILKTARAYGIDLLDTAHLYGKAESLLGSILPEGSWQVVTKTPKFSGLDAGSAVASLTSAARQSLDRLKADALYGLLVHDANDLLGPTGEALWAAMCTLRDSGRILRIGASVYDGDQVDALMSKYRLDLIQLPFNILDRRLVHGGQIDRLAAAGVEIHARSIFLQGLLLMDPGRMPAHFSDFSGHLAALRAALDEAGLTPLEGALAAAASHGAIDSVIVGVTSLHELREIVDAASKLAGSTPSLAYDDYAIDDVTLLDPQHWGTRLQPSASRAGEYRC